MLQKLRSRHPIDLPEDFGRRSPTLAILGGIALLTVAIPLVLALVGGALTVPLAVAVGFGVLLLVLLVSGVVGKAGHAR